VEEIMIGIQLDGDWGAVAAWRVSEPEVIGRGGSVAELVALAKSQGEDCRSGVVAVPAWYNDEERRQILTQADTAGISTVRIMNEPTAATLAYGVSQAALPGTSMVLNLASSGAFDVTLLARDGSRLEVLAANGIANTKEHSPDQFFAAIEPVVNRALSDARLKPRSLDVIIMTGRVDVLGSIASRIEASWGRAPVEPPFPETAIACGAAVFAGFLESPQ
jgi:molecular chaperone DnaK (HSP70)